MHSDILLAFCLAFFLACILTFFLAFTLILSGILFGILLYLSFYVASILAFIRAFYLASILTFSLWQFYGNLSGRWSGACNSIPVSACPVLSGARNSRPCIWFKIGKPHALKLEFAQGSLLFTWHNKHPLCWYRWCPSCWTAGALACQGTTTAQIWDATPMEIRNQQWESNIATASNQ